MLALLEIVALNVYFVTFCVISKLCDRRLEWDVKISDGHSIKGDVGCGIRDQTRGFVEHNPSGKEDARSEKKEGGRPNTGAHSIAIR